MGPPVFVAALLAIAVAWVCAPPLWVAARRARVAARPFPPAWRAILQRRMPAWRQLPADLQMQLRKHIQILLAEKPFIGCRGFVVTDEVRVLVAAQAALLLLNRPAGYFPRLRQILVYPDAFVVARRQTGEGGVVDEGPRALAGESWQQGQVVLSWQDVIDGAAVPDDGRNVVIHEFAHQLDQENGGANGAPALGRRADYERWAATLGRSFASLREGIVRGDPTAIDGSGAIDPAEFFAVASETFFERPAALAAADRALYGELARYYRVDPLSW